MGKAGRELDMSEIGKVLTGDAKALQGGGPVKALFIQNTNPMNVSPEQGLTRAGFAREDLFTVVHEQFMTETAEMADIVLPATMFLEHNDYYTRGGHTRVLFGPKLVEAPGECRSNFEVVNELLRRLGVERSVAAADRPRDGRRDVPALELSGDSTRSRRPASSNARGPTTMRASPMASPGRTENSASARTGRERRTRRAICGPSIRPMRRKMVDWWDINEKTTRRDAVPARDQPVARLPQFVVLARPPVAASASRRRPCSSAPTMRRPTVSPMATRCGSAITAAWWN